METCNECGGAIVYGRCCNCGVAVAMPVRVKPVRPPFDCEQTPEHFGIRPIQPLKHAGELAPFSSKSILRQVGRTVVSVALLSSQTEMGMIWLATRTDGKRVYIRQNFELPGILFSRKCGSELVIIEGGA